MNVRLAAFAVTATLATTMPVSAEDELSDLLQARWYEIEVIVFERLDVLDINSAERLTTTAARSWPANLTQLDERVDTPGQSGDLAPLITESEYCLGYPELVQDPVHPMFEVIEDDNQEPALDDELDAPGDEAPEPGPDAAASDLDDTAAAPPEQAPIIAAPEPVPELTPYDKILAEVAAFETGLLNSSYRWLDERVMEAEVKAINRNPHLRPVLHRRWRQAVPERNAPQPIYLASEIGPDAPATQEGFAKIEGYVTVTLGRYLHFAPTLWYHADNLGLAPLALPLLNPPPAPPANRYMELHESRRMRSTELHYIDHPKIGVIVRIDPVELPEDLEALWSALSEQPQGAF